MMPAVFADEMNRNDIGMNQFGCRGSFRVKTLNEFRMPCQLFWQDFNGDVATQTDLMSSIHIAHPATPNSFDNGVVPESCER